MEKDLVYEDKLPRIVRVQLQNDVVLVLCCRPNDASLNDDLRIQLVRCRLQDKQCVLENCVTRPSGILHLGSLPRIQQRSRISAYPLQAILLVSLYIATSRTTSRRGVFHRIIHCSVIAQNDSIAVVGPLTEE